MRLVSMPRRFPGFFSLFAACACAFVGPSGCGSDCGDAGCVPAVFADGTVDTASEQLTVTVCLNQRCATARVNLAAASCAELSLSSDSRICFSRGTPGRLQAELEVHSIGGELAFTDGDVLRLEVAEQSTATVIANVERTVTYEAVYPNGAECGDPCRAASVTF
jgi:hypothetical protein